MAQASLPTHPLPTEVDNSLLLDAQGNSVDLAQIWHTKPLLIIFLRHFGCASCRAHLFAIRDYYTNLVDLGAEVVAIARSSAAAIGPYAQRTRLPFALLADPTGHVFQAWGFEEGTLTEAIGAQALLRQARYALRGNISYLPFNGSLTQLGGTVIVDQSGVIRYHHLARPIYHYPPLTTYDEIFGQLNASAGA